MFNRLNGSRKSFVQEVCEIELMNPLTLDTSIHFYDFQIKNKIQLQFCCHNLKKFITIHFSSHHAREFRLICYMKNVLHRIGLWNCCIMRVKSSYANLENKTNLPKEFSVMKAYSSCLSRYI